MAGWMARMEPVRPGRGFRMVVETGGAPLPYREVLRLWREDAGFRDFFSRRLAEVPFTAFRWETPPLTAGSADRPFECVLLDSPGLAARPDPAAFHEHFTPGAEVVEFRNLGGDAVLVVPCPLGPEAAYAHLAVFLRGAPEGQRHLLWERVGEAVERRLGPHPMWVSTAGAGVSWLHVRLDDRPKYYGHSPYRGAG